MRDDRPGLEKVSDYGTISPKNFLGSQKIFRILLQRKKMLSKSEITFKFRQGNSTFLAIKMQEPPIDKRNCLALE